MKYKPILPLLLLLLVSCEMVSPDPPKGDPVLGQATVEGVEVVMLMSFPLQVHLQVSGYLADPCTEIKTIHTEREGFTFEIMIETSREAGVFCIQVEEPFEQNIPLDVYGLPAGEYTVLVNGVRTSFTFTQDNILVE